MSADTILTLCTAAGFTVRAIEIVNGLAIVHVADLPSQNPVTLQNRFARGVFHGVGYRHVCGVSEPYLLIGEAE